MPHDPADKPAARESSQLSREGRRGEREDFSKAVSRPRLQGRRRDGGAEASFSRGSLGQGKKSLLFGLAIVDDDSRGVNVEKTSRETEAAAIIS